MQLTRDQVNTILKNAPIGADKQKLLDGLVSRGYDLEGVDNEAVRQNLQKIQSSEAQKQSFVTDAITDIKETGQDLKKTYQEGERKAGEAIDAASRGEQGTTRTFLQQFGSSAGMLSGFISDIVKGALKLVSSQSVEEGASETMKNVAEPIIQSTPVKAIIEKYNNLDDKTKRDIDSALGVTSLALDLLGGGAGKKGAEVAIEQGGKLAKKGIEQGAKIVGKAGEMAGEVASKVKPAIEGVGTVGESLIQGAKRIPERIATNVEAQKAFNQSIRELPSEIAKNAVRDGIDVNDVKFLYQVPQEEKGLIKKLWTTSRDFATGNKKVNPIEVVGEPIVKRMKVLQSEATKIGRQLGEVANSLGPVSKEEATSYVLNRLKGVQGLENLAMNEKGILDFTNTVLASGGTQADRKAIQSIVLDAIKEGTGKQKHLLRQELFEILGGKKKSLTNLTDTQEKAFEAVRKGLSDLLDSKNNAYKQLNQQYAKIASPLMEVKKFAKNVGIGEEDLQALAYGLMSRRITSNAVSNPQIKSILRALDETGALEKQVTSLQDFYNVVDKYLPVQGGTTFQGQITKGIDKSIPGMLYDVAQRSAGITDEVKLKALEKAIQEALK